jgi:hypothetical protein
MAKKSLKPIRVWTKKGPEGELVDEVYLRCGVWTAHKQLRRPTCAEDYRPKRNQAAVSHEPTGLILDCDLSQKDAKLLCRLLYAAHPKFLENNKFGDGDLETCRATGAYEDLVAIVTSEKVRRGEPT